jgi:hypothetical protein
MTTDPNVALRDYATDGVPSSGVHQPLKSDLREILIYHKSLIDSGAVGGKIYASKAAMDADLTPAANTSAIIIEDATPANDGFYRKVGGTGTGSWTKVSSAVPGFQYIRAVNAGAGTANAIVATSALPIPTDAHAALILLNITVANTSTVTLAINGETAKGLKSSSGGDLDGGALIAGQVLLVSYDGTNYRITDNFSPELSAQIAQAVAAAERAELAELNAETAQSATAADRAIVVTATQEVTGNPLPMFTGTAGFLVDLTDGTTAFSNTARSAAATVGGVVKGVTDLGPNGRHFTQSVDANAPLLKRDAQGLYCLDFAQVAGVNKWLSNAAGGQSDAFFYLVAVRVNQVATVLPILSNRSGTNVGSELAVQSSARALVYTGSTSTFDVPAFPARTMAANTPGEFAIIGANYDGDTLFTSIDDEISTGTSSPTHATNATAGTFLGRTKSTNSTTSFNGDLYMAMAIERTATHDEWLRAVAYFQKRCKAHGLSVGALSFARQQIEARAADVDILIISDSLMDARDEGGFRIAQAIQRRYPLHTVTYRTFDEAGNAWQTAATLQTGTSGRTIRIHNSARSLSMPQRMMADRYANVVTGLPGCTLVLWNHGKNISTPNRFDCEIRGEFMGPMEQVRLTWPNARHAVFYQPPNRDDDNMNPIYTAIRNIATQRGSTRIIDVRKEFEAANLSPALYTDNLHPNKAGSRLYARAFEKEWDLASVVADAAVTSTLSVTATNRLLNGDFQTWSGAVPDNWTAVGSPTILKDTGNIDSAFGGAHSLKITNAGGAIGYVTQTVSAGNLTSLKTAGFASLHSRVYETLGDANTGRVDVIVTAASLSGGSATYRTYNSGDQGGAWRSQVIAGIPIPSDATAVEVRAYATGTTVTGDIASFSEMVLCDGHLPRTMA